MKRSLPSRECQDHQAHACRRRRPETCPLPSPCLPVLPCRTGGLARRTLEINQWFAGHFRAAVQTAEHWGLIDPEDVVQEAILRAAEVFDPEIGDFGSLVGRFLRQSILGRARRPTVDSVPLDENLVAPESPSASALDRLQSMRVVLEQLPASLLEPLLLHHGYGVRLAVIARDTGRTETALKRYMAQAQKFAALLLQSMGCRSTADVGRLGACELGMDRPPRARRSTGPRRPIAGGGVRPGTVSTPVCERGVARCRQASSR